MHGMTQTAFLLATFLSITPGLSAATATPRIQIALLLDTSNSMDGLIAQAKSQLWRIVNEFIPAKQDGKQPDLRVALYEYGNARLSAESGWIRQVLPFTDDLDLVSQQLFALTTRGGDEFCGQVIQVAARDLLWSGRKSDLKLIFIAGNEPYTQGPVAFYTSSRAATERGITINTIFCGPDQEGINTQWKDGAVLGGGAYMSINQDAQVVHIDAPQDKELAELGIEINKTYVAYGEAGLRGFANQSAQDANAKTAGKGSSVQRSVCKGSANYRNSWDLVDAVRAGKANLEEMKAEDFPSEMRELTLSERKALLEEKARERKRIQARIAKLSAERDRFVAEKMKEQAQAGHDTLDTAMIKAIREQAIGKNFKFD